MQQNSALIRGQAAQYWWNEFLFRKTFEYQTPLTLDEGMMAIEKLRLNSPKILQEVMDFPELRPLSSTEAE